MDQKPQCSRACPPTFCHGVVCLFLTTPHSYDAIALHRGQCKKLLRHGKLATSSMSSTSSACCSMDIIGSSLQVHVSSKKSGAPDGYSAKGTMAVRRSPPMLRLVCTCPVRSSNRTASPGPNRRVVPSPITTSIWPPERKMAYWRRGALCQSLKRPLGERVKVILLAACSIDLSMSDGSRSRSSKCD